MVTASEPMLVTTTLKVKAPPGSGRLEGVAVLSTWTAGTTSVMKTTASSLSVTSTPAGLVARTVTTSVWLAPALPLKGAVKLQL